METMWWAGAQGLKDLVARRHQVSLTAMDQKKAAIHQMLTMGLLSDDEKTSKERQAEAVAKRFEWENFVKIFNLRATDLLEAEEGRRAVPDEVVEQIANALECPSEVVKEIFPAAPTEVPPARQAQGRPTNDEQQARRSRMTPQQIHLDDLRLDLKNVSKKIRLYLDQELRLEDPHQGKLLPVPAAPKKRVGRPPGRAAGSVRKTTTKRRRR